MEYRNVHHYNNDVTAPQNDKAADNSGSLESAVSFKDWQNAVEYVFMQLNSTSGSLRKVSQMAHKKYIGQKSSFLEEDYFNRYIKKQQFYIVDDDYFTLDYVTPKSVAGKRRRNYLSLQMYILFCAHACRIAAMSQNLRATFKESTLKVSSYYGSNIIFDESGDINLDVSNHIYRSYYVSFRDDINRNISNFDVAVRIDFQDFYENISIKILLDNLAHFIHHSDKLKHDFDGIRLEKFANFFEYCMRGKGGLPQTENNYLANYIADLYLKFWDIEILSLINTIRNVDDCKLIRYVDDTYLLLKFPAGTKKDLGNSRALEILERISDLTYFKYNLRINAKTQSYWLKDKNDLIKLRKKLKSTSVDGMYFRDRGETVPKLAQAVIDALKLIGQSVSIEEYINDDSEIQETLKALYDENVQKYIMKNHNPELEEIIKTFDIDRIKLSPLPIFSIIKLFPRINDTLKKKLLELKDITTHDEHVIASYIVSNYEVNWDKSPSFKRLARKMKSPHIRELASVNKKSPSLYRITTSTDNSLYKFGDYPNFISQCRQRRLAEWDYRWSLALNHLLNEFQMICHISGQSQESLKATDITCYLRDNSISPNLVVDIRRLFDRRNYNNISHAGDVNRVIYAVSEREYSLYHQSTSKLIFELLKKIHESK